MTWHLGTPIRTDARLVEILTAIERQCVGEGLAFEVASLKVRLAAAARVERELAMEGRES